MDNTNHDLSASTPSATNNQVSTSSGSDNQSKRLYLLLLVVVVFLIFVVEIYILATRKNELFFQNPRSTTDKITPLPTIIQPIKNNVNQIAFIRSGEVWIMNEDGTGQKKLLSHTQIAFSNPNITPEDNKIISDTFNNQYFSDLSWSKDGKYLAVTSYSEAVKEEGQTRKFEFTKYEPAEIWTPPHGDIYLINTETLNITHIPEPDNYTSIPEVRWSYDDKQILFVRTKTPLTYCSVVMLDLDNKNFKEDKLFESDCQKEHWGNITWLLEKGEILAQNVIPYHVDNPEPSFIRFNYITKEKTFDSLPVTQGYRLGNYRLLNDRRIIYYNRSLGPNYGVDYDVYEIRISNYDGSDSKVIFSGDDCYSQTKEKCTRFFGFSPNGEYTVSVKNTIVYYSPFFTETPLFEELDFKNIEGFKGSYSTTWNKDGNKIAYLLNVSGIVIVQDISKKTQKTIIQDPNIIEIKWAY